MQRRSVVFAAPGTIELVDEPLPEPQAGQVRVRTRVSAISAGTEMLFYRGLAPRNMAVDASIAALDQAPVTYPLRYGYACVGSVDALGPGVDPAWLGRTVFAFQPHTSHFCSEPAALLPVPEGLDAEIAALLPNMETAVNLVMDGSPMLGEHVVVIGLGVVGLLTVRILAHFPLATLAAIDPLASRQQIARALGAGMALGPDRQPSELPLGRADLVYELSGNPAALDQAIALARFHGRVIVGSWYGEKRAPLDLGSAFHRSRITIQSSQVSTIDPKWSGRWDKTRRFAVAWELLRQIDAGQLVTHRFAIDDAAQAYQLIDQQPHHALQVLLYYSEHI